MNAPKAKKAYEENNTSNTQAISGVALSTFSVDPLSEALFLEPLFCSGIRKNKLDHAYIQAKEGGCKRYNITVLLVSNSTGMLWLRDKTRKQTWFPS